MRTRPVVACVLGALLFASSAMAQSALERAAVSWISQVKQGDALGAASRVAPDVAEALDADTIASAWRALEEKLGPLRGLGPGPVHRQGGFQVVDLRGDFEKGRVTLRVVFDVQHCVAGFFALPWAGGATWKAPDYVDRARFEERELEVGAPGWPLPGTLSVPKGEGPFPGLLLVHGSGPHDRDETLGPSRPFRDLAWGLASRGVAVLRYEKRTLEHAPRLDATPPLDAEVVDDAVAALAVLRAQPEVDGARAIVAGHSLGGMLAARIAAGATPPPAGLVLLAAPTRPFLTLFREQLDYLAGLGDESAKAMQETVAAWEKGEGGLDAIGLSDVALRELDGVEPTTEMAGFAGRVLVLQGGRDYQVTREDYAGWEAALDGREDTTFALFPDLDHRFVRGQGKARPEEYQTLGHVDVRVIEAIAAWIPGASAPAQGR